MQTTPWEYRYAHRMQKMGSSVIRELLKYTEQPGHHLVRRRPARPRCISPQGIPGGLQHRPGKAGRAGPAIQHHRRLSPAARDDRPHTPRATWSTVTPDNILITSGSQQALDFAGRLFINRGDYIVVEAPTYLGALQAWNAYGAQYIPVRTDEDGMIVDELEAALRIGPKFIYVLPNFQNPSGVTLSLERRKQADRAGGQIRRADHRRRPVRSAAL